MCPVPPLLRRIHAVLVWLIAGGFLLVLGAYGTGSEAAVSLADGFAAVLSKAIWTLGIGSLLLLVFWPPTWPWGQRGLRALKARSGVDRGPMLRALKELEHFETADKHLTIGRCNWQMGNHLKAIPHLIRALQLEPDLASARFLLGRSLASARKPTEAAAVLIPLVAKDPGHGFGVARRELAKCLVEAGDPTRALSQLDAIDQEHGGTPFSGYWRGRALDQLGDRPGAKEAWGKAASGVPATGASGSGVPRDRDANYWRALARVAPWLPTPPARPEDAGAQTAKPQAGGPQVRGPEASRPNDSGEGQAP